MNILICSDGRAASDNATRLAGLLAPALHAKTTLLGIIEASADEQALRRALEKQAESLRASKIAVETVVHPGEPIHEIVHQTSTAKYDLVIIGSRRARST
ncbi:MAG TPA: universal stress protein, partial [Chthoniobacterales bacterium]|nr:universal stress protein [Chthoniobacterales bacterium]